MMDVEVLYVDVLVTNGTISLFSLVMPVMHISNQKLKELYVASKIFNLLAI
jgi:hypothetical protein